MSRDPAVTSRIMAAVRNRDTGPELILRRELYRRGLRYRVRTQLVGKPDLVFKTARVAVFVDGDYWHGNTWRLRGHTNFDAYFDTISNGDFWRQKIAGNIARDSAVTQILTRDHWQVVRIWESEIRACTGRCADLVEQAVRHNGQLAQPVSA